MPLGLKFSHMFEPDKAVFINPAEVKWYDEDEEENVWHSSFRDAYDTFGAYSQEDRAMFSITVEGDGAHEHYMLYALRMIAQQSQTPSSDYDWWDNLATFLEQWADCDTESNVIGTMLMRNGRHWSAVGYDLANDGNYDAGEAVIDECYSKEQYSDVPNSKTLEEFKESVLSQIEEDDEDPADVEFVTMFGRHYALRPSVIDAWT